MKSNLTNEQLIDKVKAWVKKLCETGGSAWTLKVPVDLDNDPDVLIIELCNRFASQPPAQGYADSVEFEDYMGSERDNFVNEINNQKWDTKMRTAAESLLICFDQMANRLAGYSAHPPATAGMEEAVRGLDNPYPLSIVLGFLIKATEYLLNKNNYDGPDYEEMEISVKRAKEIIANLSASTPPAKDNWVKIKPDADRNFILITASFIKDYWDYKLWEIKYHDGYFKLLCDDGEEWGPYEDLKADLYFTLPTPPTT